MKHMPVEATLLFTGGKDSVYTLHLLRENLAPDGVRAVIIDPSLPHPNPHAKNMDIVVRIAELLGMKPLTLGPGNVGKDLVEAARGSQVLAAGDIYLLDHAEWLAEVAKSAGVPLVYEPLFNRDTRKLLEEIVEWGLEFTVIGVGSKEYRSLMGIKVDRESLPRFLEEVDRLGIDPMGEYAEYHTLVNKVPGYDWRITYTIKEVRMEHGWLYALLDYRVEEE